MQHDTVDAALKAHDDMEADVIGDVGEEGLEAGYGDLVAEVGIACANADVAAEFCRMKLGYVPASVARHFAATGAGGRR